MIRLRRRKKFAGNEDENDGCEEKDTEDDKEDGESGGGDLGAIAYNFALIQTKVVHYFRLFAQKVFNK